MNAEILMRVRPCNCGCKGTDPWHRSKFKRKIYDIKTHESPVQISDSDFFELKTGTARFPWGVEQVVFLGVKSTDGARMVELGWHKSGLV